MFVLISYDIAKDKTRTRLAKKLLDFGPRVQKSVFEADVNTTELQKMKEVLAKVDLAKEDSVRLYRLCAECKKNVQIWGVGEVTTDKDYYIV